MSARVGNEWVTRGLTGIAFVGVVMGAVIWSAWSNAMLWALVAALAWSEWFKAPEGPSTRWPKALVWFFPVPALAALVWLGEAEPYDPWPILSFLWMIWANEQGHLWWASRWASTNLAVGVARQILGRHRWRGRGVRTRGGPEFGMGVGVVGWTDGRTVDGRGFDPERMEAPPKHERFRFLVARTWRHHGQV